jgi:hypothetical protein
VLLSIAARRYLPECSLKAAKLSASCCGQPGERAAIDCGVAGGREVETKKAEIQFDKWNQKDQEDEPKRRRVQEEGVMIRLDFDLACNMARTGLPDGWVIEIHLEKGVSLMGLFPPNGARQDLNTNGTLTADQLLKAIAVAKGSQLASPESKSAPAKGRFHSKGKSQ